MIRALTLSLLLAASPVRAETSALTAPELASVKAATRACWNIGTLPAEASVVSVTLEVAFDPYGNPIDPSFELVSFSGGDAAAARMAFVAAKRAVLRAAKGCGGAAGYGLDPARYDAWRHMSLTFDAAALRLR